MEEEIEFERENLVIWRVKSVYIFTFTFLWFRS